LHASLSYFLELASQGLLKAKLAKYRQQLLEPAKKGAAGEGFDVAKSGVARIALLGFPSTGKSTLLGKVTKTQQVLPRMPSAS
jgi:ribosome-interacting GTPase 1